MLLWESGEQWRGSSSNSDVVALVPESIVVSEDCLAQRVECIRI